MLVNLVHMYFHFLGFLLLQDKGGLDLFRSCNVWFDNSFWLCHG